MQNDFFNELKKLFEKLPGIGPRQASRFIWAMVDFSGDERKKMAQLINSLDKHLFRCGECLRVFSVAAPHSSTLGVGGLQTPSVFPQGAALCSFCKPNFSRDHSKIMVVERDSDLSNIEKSGAYNGLYHVLGGIINPLQDNQRARDGIKKLFERLNSRPVSSKSDFRSGKKPDFFPSGREIILALSPTKLSEFTGNYIVKVLEPLKPKITRLGRGLATGTELEYADETTLRQALDNRK